MMAVLQTRTPTKRMPTSQYCPDASPGMSGAVVLQDTVKALRSRLFRPGACGKCGVGCPVVGGKGSTALTCVVPVVLHPHLAQRPGCHQMHAPTCS